MRALIAASGRPRSAPGASAGNRDRPPGLGTAAGPVTRAPAARGCRAGFDEHCITDREQHQRTARAEPPSRRGTGPAVRRASSRATRARSRTRTRGGSRDRNHRRQLQRNGGVDEVLGADDRPGATREEHGRDVCPARMAPKTVAPAARLAPAAALHSIQRESCGRRVRTSV